MRNVIVMAVAASILSLQTYASPVEDGPPADCTGVKIATGPKGKGYSNLFADLQKVCGQKVSMCEVTTNGGLDNLNALAIKEADLGFVQYDTWVSMKNGDDNIASLQSVIPLNYNYLHVVVSTQGYREEGINLFRSKSKTVISQFTDLRGKPIALVGSAQLLGRQLESVLGFKMTFVDAQTDTEAFNLVKDGTVAAAFTVSGWPSGPIKNLQLNSGLTLVPFNAPVNDIYKVKPLNYKNLAVYNNNSLGAQNVLVTRPFSGQRAQTVKALQSCIFANLTELKEGSYQPAWNEVNPQATLNGMTPFKVKE